MFFGLQEGESVKLIDEIDFKIESEKDVIEILREGIAIGDTDIPYEAYISSEMSA